MICSKSAALMVLLSAAVCWNAPLVAMEMVSVKAAAADGAPGVYEIDAVVLLDAPAAGMRHAISRLCDHRERFRYLIHCQVFKLSGNTAWSYSQVDGTFVRPRDYIIATQLVEDLKPDGSGTFHTRWWLDNAAGPPPRQGIIRVAVNSGSWMMDAVENGKRTRLHYRMRVAPGGRVPAWAAAIVLEKTVPDYFRALEQLGQARGGLRGAPLPDLWDGINVTPMETTTLPPPEPKGWVPFLMTF